MPDPWAPMLAAVCGLTDGSTQIKLNDHDPVLGRMQVEKGLNADLISFDFTSDGLKH